MKSCHNLLKKIGEVIKDTNSGPILRIKPIETSANKLRLLKVRKPYEDRPERGDADFTVANYKEFKSKYIKNPNFNLIERPDFEMIELVEPDSEFLVYFSNPTQEELLNL